MRSLAHEVPGQVTQAPEVQTIFGEAGKLAQWAPHGNHVMWSLSVHVDTGEFQDVLHPLRKRGGGPFCPWKT